MSRFSGSNEYSSEGHNLLEYGSGGDNDKPDPTHRHNDAWLRDALGG